MREIDDGGICIVPVMVYDGSALPEISNVFRHASLVVHLRGKIDALYWALSHPNYAYSPSKTGEFCFDQSAGKKIKRVFLDNCPYKHGRIIC